MLTETFNLFTDTGLTTGFSGYFDLIHYTDESDNPQDKTLYFGSLGSAGLDTTDRKCRANSDPGVDNIVLAISYILPQWTAATAYVVGDCVEPVTPNGYRFKCTTAGTSHATTEPVWGGMGGLGSTIVDGTVTWTKVSATHGTSEITLGLTQADLSTNTPGASLSIGNTVMSGTSNKITIWVRIENNVNTVSNNTATPELGCSFTQLLEEEV